MSRGGGVRGVGDVRGAGPPGGSNDVTRGGGGPKGARDITAGGGKRRNDVTEGRGLARGGEGEADVTAEGGDVSRGGGGGRGRRLSPCPGGVT